jgi:hypothetical protein
MTSKRATAEPIEVEEHEPELEPEPEHEPLLDRLEHFGQNVTDFVVQRPLTSVGIAVGVGFLLGRAMRRW